MGPPAEIRTVVFALCACIHRVNTFCEQDCRHLVWLVSRGGKAGFVRSHRDEHLLRTFGLIDGYPPAHIYFVRLVPEAFVCGSADLSATSRKGSSFGEDAQATLPSGLFVYSAHPLHCKQNCTRNSGSTTRGSNRNHGYNEQNQRLVKRFGVFGCRIAFPCALLVFFRRYVVSRSFVCLQLVQPAPACGWRSQERDRAALRANFNYGYGYGVRPFFNPVPASSLRRSSFS